MHLWEQIVLFIKFYTSQLCSKFSYKYYMRLKINEMSLSGRTVTYSSLLLNTDVTERRNSLETNFQHVTLKGLLDVKFRGHFDRRHHEVLE